MKKFLMIAIPALLVLLAPALQAQTNFLENHPGYFDFSAFESFAVEGETVDVSLDESLIGFMAAGVEEEKPEVAEALNKIKRVAVRVFPIDAKDNQAIRDQIEMVEQNMQSGNWKRVVRVIEDEENVYLYIQSSAGLIEGLAVMVISFGDEAVFVNVVGEIDPKTLAILFENADVFEEAGLEDILDEMGME